MTNNNGYLHKMDVQLSAPVAYRFRFGQQVESGILVNDYLGKQLSLEFTGRIACIACGRAIKKTFSQGYCFPCSQKLAACDLCILRPWTCHYHLGTCREPEWGEQHCFIPHIVYLANSSDLKIGLTRHTQVPTRWIDQGAIQALPLISVQSRYQAGLLEQAFSAQINDRTDWRKMLRADAVPQDLLSKRDELFVTMRSKIQEVAGRFPFGAIELLTNEAVQNITYPVLEYPKKLKALSFDDTAQIDGTLLGIKGQYLLFEHGVLNVRKFTGYEITAG